MKLYGLKNCDTCRKAIRELAVAGLSHEYIDVRADGVSADDLQTWIARLGSGELVNRRSTTWRGLSDKEKDDASDPEKLVALLQQYPTLIKRPVVENGNDIFVGWTPDIRTALGL